MRTKKEYVYYVFPRNDNDLQFYIEDVYAVLYANPFTSRVSCIDDRKVSNASLLLETFNSFPFFFFFLFSDISYPNDDDFDNFYVLTFVQREENGAKEVEEEVLSM